MSHALNDEVPKEYVLEDCWPRHVEIVFVKYNVLQRMVLCQMEQKLLSRLFIESYSALRKVELL